MGQAWRVILGIGREFIPAGGDEFYVNLFIPSVLEWEERDVYIRQEPVDGYPKKVKISAKGRGIRKLKVRLPEWAVAGDGKEEGGLSDESVEIEENDERVAIQADENGYLVFSRDFSKEITFELEFAFRFRMIRTPDVRERAAVAYGPFIMAALSRKKEFLSFPFTEADIEEKMVPSKDGFSFTCEGIRWIPLCMVDEEAYHVYGTAGYER